MKARAAIIVALVALVLPAAAFAWYGNDLKRGNYLEVHENLYSTSMLLKGKFSVDNPAYCPLSQDYADDTIDPTATLISTRTRRRASSFFTMGGWCTARN